MRLGFGVWASGRLKLALDMLRLRSLVPMDLGEMPDGELPV